MVVAAVAKEEPQMAPKKSAAYDSGHCQLARQLPEPRVDRSIDVRAYPGMEQ